MALRMTLAEAETLLGRKASKKVAAKHGQTQAAAPAPGPKFNRMEHAGGTAARVSRGRVRTKREEGMNKLEADYEREVLKPALQAGDIVWYRYESLKLRLADNTFLTIDFFVMTKDGDLEAHETKGFFEEDAKVKWKVAIAMYPFRFKLIRRRAKKDGGGFSVEVFE